MTEFFQQFWEGLLHTGWLEFIAVISGIASVWFSKRENILVYPVGLVNTITYIYLSVKGQLFGEASVNVYYTLMSLYGWWFWSRRNEKKEIKTPITFSSHKEWIYQLLFFFTCYLLLFFSLQWLQQSFAPGAIPWADAFASATAFTGMWLMARKKVESWYWWIATNIASIPLYGVKGYAFTAVYYFLLLLLAISGLREWRKRAFHS